MDMTGLSGLSAGSTGPVTTYGIGPTGERGSETRQFNYDGAYSSANPKRGGSPDAPQLTRSEAFNMMNEQDPAMAARFKEASIANEGQVNWDQVFGKNYGGVIQGYNAGGGYAGGGHYNVNELGPENIFSGGVVTRNANPQTISPSRQGYVQPQGRDSGGYMDPKAGYNPGVTSIPGGSNPQESGPKTVGSYNGPSNNPGDNTTGYSPGVYTMGSVNDYNAGPQQGPAGPQSGGGTYNQDGSVVENPGGREGGYSFKADPGYNFRFDEGQRMLETGGSASGGLLSGGFAKKSIRYGQDYASGEFQNVYNRIANIAGLGQVSTQNNNALNAQYGQNIGGAMANQGMNTAYGQQASANAWANAGNQIAQLPWGNVFGGSGGAVDQRSAWGGGGGNYT